MGAIGALRAPPLLTGGARGGERWRAHLDRVLHPRAQERVPIVHEPPSQREGEPRDGFLNPRACTHF